MSISLSRGISTNCKEDEERPSKRSQVSTVKAIKSTWPNRIDERVRVLDVSDGGVERQAEADRVAQTFLEAHGIQQQHVPEKIVDTAVSVRAELTRAGAPPSYFTWTLAAARWTAGLRSGWSCCSDPTGQDAELGCLLPPTGLATATHPSG